MYDVSFPAVCVFVLGKRLGCLEQEIPADCKVFIKELHNFLATTQELRFNFPFHKFITTKNWKALAHSQKCIYDVAMSHIQEKVINIVLHSKCNFYQRSNIFIMMPTVWLCTHKKSFYTVYMYM